MSHPYRFFTLLGGLLFFILPFLHKSEDIRYNQASTIPFDWDNIQLDTMVFPDTIADNVLYQLKNAEGIPLFYSQDIVTEVCFDNKCRLLSITVFWNVTGRYLGFELIDGEYLSKQEHEAFSTPEYERLNDLLADPSLPLGEITFKNLIKVPPVESKNVDGVSGATTVDVSKIVVKGAAYTTYTLWNIVHGSTKDLVSSLTEKEMSPPLMMLILKSPDISDKVWALNRIDQDRPLSPKLKSILFEFIDGDDFFLAYSALNAIGPIHLTSEPVQNTLFSAYTRANHSIQKMIVDKLMYAPNLSSEVVKNSRELLSELNGKQLGDFLRLYSKHTIYDMKTLETVGMILKNENSFISRQAEKFLKESPLSDIEIDALRNK